MNKPRFLVLSSPRCGSEAFFAALRAAGVLTGGRFTAPLAFEVFNVARAPALIRSLGIPTDAIVAGGPAVLLDAFLEAQLRDGSPFAGAKLFAHQLLMFCRRVACVAPAETLLVDLLTRPDLDLVALDRRDIVARVASALVATRTGDWLTGAADQGVVLEVDADLLVRAGRWARRFALNDGCNAQLPVAARFDFQALAAIGFDVADLAARFGLPAPAGPTARAELAAPPAGGPPLPVSDRARFAQAVLLADANARASFPFGTLGAALTLALERRVSSIASHRPQQS